MAHKEYFPPIYFGPADEFSYYQDTHRDPVALAGRVEAGSKYEDWDLTRHVKFSKRFCDPEKRLAGFVLDWEQYKAHRLEFWDKLGVGVRGRYYTSWDVCSNEGACPRVVSKQYWSGKGEYWPESSRARISFHTGSAFSSQSLNTYSEHNYTGRWVGGGMALAWILRWFLPTIAGWGSGLPGTIIEIRPLNTFYGKPWFRYDCKDEIRGNISAELWGGGLSGHYTLPVYSQGGGFPPDQNWWYEPEDIDDDAFTISEPIKFQKDRVFYLRFNYNGLPPAVDHAGAPYPSSRYPGVEVTCRFGIIEAVSNKRLEVFMGGSHAGSNYRAYPLLIPYRNLQGQCWNQHGWGDSYMQFYRVSGFPYWDGYWVWTGNWGWKCPLERIYPVE